MDPTTASSSLQTSREFLDQLLALNARHGRGAEDTASLPFVQNERKRLEVLDRFLRSHSNLDESDVAPTPENDEPENSVSPASDPKTDTTPGGAP